MTGGPAIYDAFLSYDHGDAGVVERLAAGLKMRGLDVWQDADQIRPADRWASRIETGLRSCRFFALVVSGRALQSRWVMDEYFAALAIANSPGSSLELVPLLVEDVALPVFLKIRQWVDFRDPDSFEQRLDTLSQTLRAGRVAARAELSSALDAGTERGPRDVNAELEYLGRALQRELRTMRELRAVRVVAPFAGCFTYPALIYAGFNMPASLGLALATASITGLVGLGATVHQMTAARANTDKLLLLQKGIDRCPERYESTCDRLWTEFWRVVHGSAAVTTN